MTHLRPVSFLALLLCLPLAAQDDMPGPAPELARLKPLAGNWEGAGTAVFAPGAPASKWTGKVTSEWALGGHWLMTDTEILFEGEAPMRFHEYTGWDRENRRYVQLTVNNMGEGLLNTVHFVGDDTMVLMMPNMREGTPQIERALTKFGADSQTFSMAFFGHEGVAREGVTGTFKRVAKTSLSALESASAMGPANPAMAKIARMAGSFEVAGEMTMAPGQPAMKIKGVDAIRTLFDGAIVQVTTTGTADGMPGTYEAHGYYAWDATDGAYDVLMVSNMGEVMKGEARFAGDDTLVQIFSGLRMGQLSVSRSVMQLDAKGHPKKVVNHSCMGAADPMQDFVGTYEAASGK